MRKFLLGIFVAIAVALTACGGGGGDDDTAAEDDGEESADEDGGRNSGRPDRPEGSDDPADEPADDGATEGGSGDMELSADEQEYVDALLPAFEGSSVAAEETSCFVRAYVEVIGIERLRELAPPEEIADNPMATPADLGIELSQADGERFYDMLATCMDVRAVFLTSLMGGDPTFTDCINGAVDEALLRRYVVALFVTDPEATDPDLEAAFADIYATCQPTSPTP